MTRTNSSVVGYYCPEHFHMVQDPSPTQCTPPTRSQASICTSTSIYVSHCEPDSNTTESNTIILSPPPPPPPTLSMDLIVVAQQMTAGKEYNLCASLAANGKDIELHLCATLPALGWYVGSPTLGCSGK